MCFWMNLIVYFDLYLQRFFPLLKESSPSGNLDLRILENLASSASQPCLIFLGFICFLWFFYLPLHTNI